MEPGYKHFSHTHKLEMHKMPEGAEVSCSGCNSSANKTIYACWQCNFFLHEQCFLATRSKKHSSHPLHPLTLVPYPTYLSNSFYCDNCKIIGTGFSYTCSDCDFDIHVHCANSLSDSTNAHHQSYVSQNLLNFPPSGHNSSLNPYPTNITHDSYMAQHVSPFTAPNPTTCAQNMYASQNFMNIPTSSQNLSIPQYPTSITHHSNMTYNVSRFNVPPIPQNLTTTPQNAYSSQSYMNIPASAQHLPIPQNTTFNLAPSASYEQQSHFGESGQNIAKNKGIIHFSHPHALVWVDIKHVKKKITCSGCQQSLVGKGYACDEENCGFHLDEFCFNLEKEIRHKSHPAHPLSLLSSSPQKTNNTGMFTCDACFKNGSGFTYHCSICEYDLDITCANLKETVKRDDHQHVLKICYHGPLDGKDAFYCDVSNRVVPGHHWAYYCQECDYGTHSDCVHREECDNSSEDPVSDEQSLYEAILTARMDALGRKYALELWD